MKRREAGWGGDGEEEGNEGGRGGTKEVDRTQFQPSVCAGEDNGAPSGIYSREPRSSVRQTAAFCRHLVTANE